MKRERESFRRFSPPLLRGESANFFTLFFCFKKEQLQCSGTYAFRDLRRASLALALRRLTAPLACVCPLIEQSDDEQPPMPPTPRRNLRRCRRRRRQRRRILPLDLDLSSETKPRPLSSTPSSRAEPAPLPRPPSTSRGTREGPEFRERVEETTPWRGSSEEEQESTLLSFFGTTSPSCPGSTSSRSPKG